jgi:ATP-binding cassette subfamily F protein 3
VRAALAGVGFGEDELDKPVRPVGGEEARAALAASLENPDVLLLDEPTNHLDFAALDWFEEQLLCFAGALVLVSHDRHLLERVANRTWEVAFGQVTIYRLGYEASRGARDAEREKLLEAFVTQEETIEKYKDFIRRHKMGQKHRQAKDREKKLERIEEARIEAPREQRSPRICRTTSGEGLASGLAAARPAADHAGPRPLPRQKVPSSDRTAAARRRSCGRSRATCARSMARSSRDTG